MNYTIFTKKEQDGEKKQKIETAAIKHTCWRKNMRICDKSTALLHKTKVKKSCWENMPQQQRPPVRSAIYAAQQQNGNGTGGHMRK